MWFITPLLSSTLKILILLSCLDTVWACKFCSDFNQAGKWALLILPTLTVYVLTAHLEAAGSENKDFFVDIPSTAPLLPFCHFLQTTLLPSAPQEVDNVFYYLLWCWIEHFLLRLPVLTGCELSCLLGQVWGWLDSQTSKRWEWRSRNSNTPPAP